jgi:hypothetical protein
MGLPLHYLHHCSSVIEFMKTIILLLILILPYVSVRGQVDDGIFSKHDSLCKLLDADTTAENMEFEIVTQSENYLPIVWHYKIKVKNNFIVKMECRHSYIQKYSTKKVGSHITEKFRFHEGLLLTFDQYDYYFTPDSLIRNNPAAIAESKLRFETSLHVYLSEGIIFSHFSNGHGFADEEDFDVKDHCQTAVSNRKEYVKSRFPDLK